MRKSLVATATALSMAAAGLVATGVVIARPATAAIDDVPADCFVAAAAYRSDGQALSYRYSAKKPSTQAISGDKLGWVPTGLVTFLESGDDNGYRNRSLVTHPTNGYIYAVDRVVERVDGGWKATKHTVTRVKAGFGGTRLLTMAYPYLYRVAGTSLYRYKLSFSNGVPTLSAPLQLSSSGWDVVNTLAYERTAGVGSAAVDTLIGATSTGHLKEWRINYATPAKITGKSLRASGWGSFTSVNTGFCNSHPNGRALLGITADGRASVHFDANRTDGVGTDIKGGSLGSLGWTAKSYNH
ncbi:hypothetical protein [Kribbella deserti]|uniref:Secreted protein n=1 Tax=Kribbella deserti TaxID=1926257 RepID=A0ABV6QL57_9ACTN